ncbi:MAG TPA: hypothetical protein VE978_21375 [Chitinophagales bacterium]|nr:hypothetical protein [Chitinophagales bacterium]
MVPVKTITYSKSGGPLKVCFKFHGLIAAAYTYTLWAADQNTQLEKHTGNNMNTADDEYTLPAGNKGEIIDLLSTFRGLPVGDSTNYGIIIEVYQDGKLLDSDTESGDIGNESKISQLFVQLNEK